MIKELFKAVYLTVSGRVSKNFKPFCQKHALFMGGLHVISLPTLFILVWGQMSNALEVDSINNSINNAGNTNQVASLIESESQQSNELSKGGSETFIFTENWSVSSENLISMSITGAISLAEEIGVAQIDYQGIMPVREDFGFSFAHEGVNPNVIAGRPEFWEVVVGDNDASVVSLRATDKIRGPLEPIVEIGGHPRPRTNHCQFVPGEEIRVEFSETYTQSSNLFSVEVTVTCNSGLSDVFRWEFIPPPKWTDREKFYLGLMDLDGLNQTKIHFIDPNVLYIKELLSR